MTKVLLILAVTAVLWAIQTKELLRDKEDLERWLEVNRKRVGELTTPQQMRYRAAGEWMSTVVATENEETLKGYTVINDSPFGVGIREIECKPVGPDQCHPIPAR